MNGIPVSKKYTLYWSYALFALNGSDEKFIFFTPLLNSECEIVVWTYMLGIFLFACCLSPRINAMIIKLMDEYLN